MGVGAPLPPNAAGHQRGNTATPLRVRQTIAGGWGVLEVRALLFSTLRALSLVSFLGDSGVWDFPLLWDVCVCGGGGGGGGVSYSGSTKQSRKGSRELLLRRDGM